MKKIALVLFVLMFVALPASAQEDTFLETVSSYILESAKYHNLEPENLSIRANDGGEVDMEDVKFIGLLGGKLRIARIIKNFSYISERSGTSDILKFLTILSDSGSVDMTKSPFNLSDYLVYQIVLPLKLEPVIRELPVYYDAVVSTKDWEEKFEAILELGDYGNLNGGKTFYLAGFPKINRGSGYTSPLDVELIDGDTLAIYEGDSSIEAWLYSFWMRRHKDGSMELVKKILDWLNAELDVVENAAG